MDTALKKDRYEQLAPVWSGSFSRDFTAESIVPDAMPDVAAVVDADGIITLRSKETEAGAVALAASVAVSVMYMPEGGGAMESLSVTVPVELRADAPGADTDCRTVARLRIRALDARIVNSRKLSVRVDVDCEARVYQRRTIELPSGLETPQAGVHILTKTAPMVTVADVREKTFVVTDEYPLPAGGVERILSQRAEVKVEDVKYASGKVVFRGRVRAGLVFACREAGPIAGRYETEFTQIMEVDTQAPDVTAEVALAFTGVYFDLPDRQTEDGKVAAELHLAAQTVCHAAGEAAYIADLYSNCTALAGQPEQVELVSAVHAVNMRQTVTGTAELMGGSGEVLAISAAVGGVTVEHETVRTTVNVRVITAREDGGFSAARCRLAAEFTTDIGPETALQGVTVSAADVYCSASGGSLDVRAALEMDALAVSNGAITAMTGLTEDPEGFAAAPAPASLTLVRVEPGTDMWAVAKRYRSTVEAIAAANGERSSGLLLVPKAR